MVRSRKPGERAGLSREGVLAAAGEVLAAGGLEGLTMRAIAHRLGVAPNALYSHVANKTTLIDAVLDDVLAQVKPPAADSQDPAAGLHAMMISTYRVLLAHPDLVPLYLARQGARGSNAQRLGDVMLALLDRAGVGGPAAMDARRVLIVYTIGFAAFVSRPAGHPWPDQPMTEAQSLANFTTGLGWLLTGIGSGRQTRRPARRGLS